MHRRTVQGKPRIEITVSEAELLSALGIDEPGYWLLTVRGTGPFTLVLTPKRQS